MCSLVIESAPCDPAKRKHNQQLQKYADWIWNSNVVRMDGWGAEGCYCEGGTTTMVVPCLIWLVPNIPTTNWYQYQRYYISSCLISCATVACLRSAQIWFSVMTHKDSADIQTSHTFRPFSPWWGIFLLLFFCLHGPRLWNHCSQAASATFKITQT